MWRHKIRTALARPPQFAEMSEGGLRGKYLYISNLDAFPAVFGPVRGQTEVALVYDLCFLREGENLMMAEICQYPTGSDKYRLWLEDVHSRVAAAGEHNVPVFAETLRCGTKICVFPYVSQSPETCWETPLPVLDIRSKSIAGELDAAAELAERAIAKHGRKAILLQCLAEIRHAGGAFDSARALFLEAVEAHRAEGNASLLATMLGLATTLLDLHTHEAGEAENSPWPMPVVTPVTKETKTFPVDLEDEAFEVLIETLFIEPYNPTALLLLSRMIGQWEIESLYRVTRAFLAIDQSHPKVDEIRKRHNTVAEQGPGALLQGPSRAVIPADMPENAALKLQQMEAAYEPPLPDAVASAWGLAVTAEWRLAQGDTARAERDARRAVSRDPFDGLGHAMLADILCAGGRWVEARELLTEAVKTGVHDWEVHSGLGQIASELNEHAESCVQFHLALAREPTNPAEIKARLGTGYRKIGHMDQARAYLNDATSEDPDSYLATLFLLQHLKQTVTDATETGDRDHLENAVAGMDQILSALEARGGLHPEFLFVQSQVMAVTGQLDLAEATLRRASELDPTLEHIRQFLEAIVEWRA